MTLQQGFFKNRSKFELAMLMFWMMWTVYLSAHLGREVAEGDIVWTIGYMIMIVVSMSLMLIQYFAWHLSSIKTDSLYRWGNNVMKFVKGNKQ